MFLVFKSSVHQDAQDFDMVFGPNDLSFDGKRLLVQFVGLRGEVYNSCFLCFKSRSTPPFPVERFINNCFNTLPVTLRSWPGYLCGKVIHESNRSSLAVDLSLNKVCVEEEE